MIELANFPLSLIFAASLVLILTASEIGHQLGRRVMSDSLANSSRICAPPMSTRGSMPKVQPIKPSTTTVPMPTPPARPAVARDDLQRDGLSVIHQAALVHLTASRWPFELQG